VLSYNYYVNTQHN